MTTTTTTTKRILGATATKKMYGLTPSEVLRLVTHNQSNRITNHMTALAPIQRRGIQGGYARNIMDRMHRHQSASDFLTVPEIQKIHSNMASAQNKIANDRIDGLAHGAIKPKAKRYNLSAKNELTKSLKTEYITLSNQLYTLEQKLSSYLKTGNARQAKSTNDKIYGKNYDKVRWNTPEGRWNVNDLGKLTEMERMEENIAYLNGTHDSLLIIARIFARKGLTIIAKGMRLEKETIDKNYVEFNGKKEYAKKWYAHGKKVAAQILNEGEYNDMYNDIVQANGLAIQAGIKAGKWEIMQVYNFDASAEQIAKNPMLSQLRLVPTSGNPADIKEVYNVTQNYFNYHIKRHFDREYLPILSDERDSTGVCIPEYDKSGNTKGERVTGAMRAEEQTDHALEIANTKAFKEFFATLPEDMKKLSKLLMKGKRVEVTMDGHGRKIWKCKQLSLKELASELDKSVKQVRTLKKKLEAHCRSAYRNVDNKHWFTDSIVSYSVDIPLSSEEMELNDAKKRKDKIDKKLANEKHKKMLETLNVKDTNVNNEHYINDAMPNNISTIAQKKWDEIESKRLQREFMQQEKLYFERLENAFNAYKTERKSQAIANEANNASNNANTSGGYKEERRKYCQAMARKYPGILIPHRYLHA